MPESLTTDLGRQSAFPSEQTQHNQYANGLTKRELLAAMAMQGLYASTGFPVFSRQDEVTHKDGCHTSRTERAKEAALAADALLAALKDLTP